MTLHNSDSKLLPRWFTIWFYVSSLVFFAGGLVDRVSGKALEAGVDFFGATLSVFVLYLLVVFLWRKREYLWHIAAKIPLSLLFKSVLIGWFFAMIDEIVSFPFNPLFPGISLINDLILTTPMYILVHAVWFWILKRYTFTVREALVVGGFSLGLTEIFGGLFFGGSILVDAFIGIFIAFPFVVMVHGPHMVMPALFLKENFERFSRKEKWYKYILGTSLPFLASLVGVGIIVLLLPLIVG